MFLIYRVVVVIIIVKKVKYKFGSSFLQNFNINMAVKYVYNESNFNILHFKNKSSVVRVHVGHQANFFSVNIFEAIRLYCSWLQVQEVEVSV